jgi:phosphatidylethanolamine/phosphatidyl-N-methylethanolamine N-methyltransferase
VAAQLSDVKPDEYVVELGPGTGAVTRGICKAVAQKQLVLVERDAEFLPKLRQEFPEALVLLGDARYVNDLLQQHGITSVAAVISGLPCLTMPDQVREMFVGAVFKLLKRDGVFIQYTYSLLSPVPPRHQRAIGIRGAIAKQIWRNVPPARVWRYKAVEAFA